MRKVFFFLFLVTAIWTGLEVMNKGMAGAFDGLFVRMGMASPDQGPETTPMSRSAQRVKDAYRQSEERVDRQLE